VDLAAELPVRVARMDDGLYQVVDGFKRLERWREQGRGCVPVIVECPRSVLELKRLLLAVNAPPRTLTALDEAAVVRSLIVEDGLSVRAVAALLGRRPAWVTNRHKLATRLAAYPSEMLARGRLRPTLAGLLATLPAKDQDALARGIERHSLSGREAATLIHAYRAGDESDRRALLHAPLLRVRPAAGSSLTGSPRAESLESRLLEIRRTLLDFESFTFPGDLAPAEARRLDAIHRSIVLQLKATAQKLSQSFAPEENILEEDETKNPLISPDTRRGGSVGDVEGVEDGSGTATYSETEKDSTGRKEAESIEETSTHSQPKKRRDQDRRPKRDSRAEPIEETSTHSQPKKGRDQGRSPKRDSRARPILRDQKDRRAGGADPQASVTGAPRGGSNDAVLHARQKQARSVSGADRCARRQGPDHDKNPPRDPGSGLFGTADNPGQIWLFCCFRGCSDTGLRLTLSSLGPETP
jgi:hypothetical protein